LRQVCLLVGQAGAGLLIVGLLFTAPADMMVRLTSGISGLQMYGVSGSFLSGEVEQVNYRGKSIKQLAWTVSLSSLITGKAGSHLQVDDPVFAGNVLIEQSVSNTLSLSDIKATQSVSALADYWPLLKLVYPEGELVWQDVSLSMDEKEFASAEGDINWNGASITANNRNFSLGTVNIKLDTDKGDLLLTISDQNSVLDLQGILRLSRDQQYQLKIDISEDLPTEIKNAVLMVARPDGNGRLVLNTKGRL